MTKCGDAAKDADKVWLSYSTPEDRHRHDVHQSGVNRLRSRNGLSMDCHQTSKNLAQRHEQVDVLMGIRNRGAASTERSRRVAR